MTLSKDLYFPCACGHPAKDHYEDGNGGFATCDHEDCDCEWYVANTREKSAEQ